MIAPPVAVVRRRLHERFWIEERHLVVAVHTHTYIMAAAASEQVIVVMQLSPC